MHAGSENLREALFPVAEYAGHTSESANLMCRSLEEGRVLFFAQSPVQLAESDLEFLRSLEQKTGRSHKNLAYHPTRDRISSVGEGPEASLRLRNILRGYSAQVASFLTQFATPYQGRWQVDSTSFRPIEERGRALPIHKRNDRLHVDAFPTRPTQGARILRFFQNIHPHQPREWVVGEPFRTLLPQFAPAKIALPKAENRILQGARMALCRTALGHTLGRAIPTLKRSSYDRFMLALHNALKESDAYQANACRERISFPPGSAWLVYTDAVPHAVLSGRYALEQTMLVEREAMVAPEYAPLNILESLAGTTLV